MHIKKNKINKSKTSRHVLIFISITSQWLDSVGTATIVSY